MTELRLLMSAIQNDIFKKMINRDFAVYTAECFWSLECIPRSSWTKSFFARFQNARGPRRDGNHRGNIIPIRNKYRHVGLVRQYWCVCLSSGCLWGPGKGAERDSAGPGGWILWASEWVIRLAACVSHKSVPTSVPAPLRLRWNCSGFERRRTEWLTDCHLLSTSWPSPPFALPRISLSELYSSNFPQHFQLHILPNAWRTGCTQFV